MADRTSSKDDKQTDTTPATGGGTLDGKAKDASEDPAYGHAFEDQAAGVGANLTGK